MDWGVAPSLVEKASSAVQMRKVILICLAAPEIHVCNFKIAPEMACTVSVCFAIVLWPQFAVDEPIQCVVFMEVLWMRGEEFDGLRPKCGDRLRRVEYIDVEAIGFVVVLHVMENVVVDVAEEFDLGFDAPIVADVFELRMMIEHATVPPTHLVIRNFVGVLHVLFLEYFDRLLVDIIIDPGWDGPVIAWDSMIVALRLGLGLSFLFELLGERDIVEECPRIVKFGVPRSLEIAHGREEIFKLSVSDE